MLLVEIVLSFFYQVLYTCVFIYVCAHMHMCSYAYTNTHTSSWHTRIHKRLLREIILGLAKILKPFYRMEVEINPLLGHMSQLWWLFFEISSIISTPYTPCLLQLAVAGTPPSKRVFYLASKFNRLTREYMYFAVPLSVVLCWEDSVCLGKSSISSPASSIHRPSFDFW